MLTRAPGCHQPASGVTGLSRLQTPMMKNLRKNAFSVSLLAVLPAIVGLRACVFEAFKIPSGSMTPTLQVGDHIFVNKFIYGPAIPFTRVRLWDNLPPKRGDVMLFAYPEDPQKDFIKRVVGLPGDRVEVRDGHPVINGWKVPNCLVGTFEITEDVASSGPRRSGELFVEYLGNEAFLTFYDASVAAAFSGRTEGPFTVLPNQAFVLGDNRHNSHDSRTWFNGQGGGVPFANIRGKAFLVWMTLRKETRFGTLVMGRPRLPDDMKHLDGAMEKCLRERPAVTEPPPATNG